MGLELRWMSAALSPAERREARGALTPAEHERYESLAAGDSFLAGRLLLRRLAVELTGREPVLVTVCPDCGGCHGKPVLEDSGLHLSLSHTQGFVVAAAHRNASVGIDVEELQQSDDRLDAIEAMTGQRCLRAWTRVEAVLKADGRGLRVDPSLVSIEGDTAVLGDARYALSEAALAPELQVSVAVRL